MFRSFRYTFIIVLVGLGTALAAVGGWRYARASAPVNGPIIVLSVDTLRADRLPVYGYTKVRTPAIDSLAADGIVFERAYSHAPQTLPAHASMLSGRLPFDTGVRDNIGFTVKPEERLLPEMLRERGFSTGGVVSTDVLRSETGISQGFDFFDAGMPPDSADAGAGPVQRDGAASEAIAEKWLASQQSPRLFLFLHLYEPHAPYAPPERFSELEPYDGEVAYSDEIIGRFLRYLKSHQLYDQSTIVLVSDHGEGLGDHGEQEHGLFVYDETVRVPLIIKQAGNARAGQRVADLVQHVDIVPTLLELAKAPVPRNLQGESLIPLLEGSGRLRERAVYSEALYARSHFGWSELVALTDGRYRYIKAPREELYDLERDPQEQDNVADVSARVVKTLGATLERLIESTASVDALPDPKDKVHIVETYRQAVEADRQRNWVEASNLFRQILNEDPELIDVWDRLATVSIRAERYEQALDAYKHIVELRPTQTSAYLGAAVALLKLKKVDDAQGYAEFALAVAADPDSRGRAEAHKLFVEARILHDRGKYIEALPLFQAAIAKVKDPGALHASELHFYAADTFVRLERHAEAERQFLAELKYFPRNARAHAGLATLFHATERPDAAAETLDTMLRTIPTPETYALAARLWTTFGDRQRAEAVRAEARRALKQEISTP